MDYISVYGIAIYGTSTYRRVMMATLAELEVQVARTTSLEANAMQLIRDIAQLLIDRQADVTKIQEIMDALKVSADSLETTMSEVVIP